MAGRLTPNTHFGNFPDQRQRFPVTASLHAAPQNSEDAGTGRSEQFGGGGGNGGGPHLGNEAAIHDGEGCAGFRIAEKNRGHVSRNSAGCIRRIKGDDLDTESIAQRRHQAKKTAGGIDRNEGPDRLDDLSGGKSGQRLFHGRDEILHPEMPADGVFVQNERGRGHRCRILHTACGRGEDDFSTGVMPILRSNFRP